MLTMMGEAVLTKGTMKINGKLSYLSSTYEIIIPGSIKDNILLGEKYNPEKFIEVLEVVEFDLTRFKAGEELEILHNGSNISTDERKKMLLARLLYHGGDIICLEYFFDDWYPPLSERIFNRLIKEYLVGKTVIYSTNISKFMKLSDTALYFENG